MLRQPFPIRVREQLQTSELETVVLLLSGDGVHGVNFKRYSSVLSFELIISHFSNPV